MADNFTKKITLWINGKEVEDNIKNIRAEMAKLINSQAKMTRGSDEYVAAGKEIKALKGIIQEHNDTLKATSNAWDKIKETALGFLGAEVIMKLGGMLKGFFETGIEKAVEYEEQL